MMPPAPEGHAPACSPSSPALLVRLLDWLLPHKNIVNCARQLYLRRWYLFRCRWFAIFLHNFVRSDEDRALRDHPWPFLVIPIWRGYREHNDRPCGCWICSNYPIRLPNVSRVLPFLGTRFRRATYRHRVELLTDDGGNELPAWSLFVRFKEYRMWGFWMPEGFIAWNVFWREKCE